MTQFKTIRIDAKTAKKLKIHVVKYGYTLSGFISFAVEEGIKRDVAARKEFKQLVTS